MNKPLRITLAVVTGVVLWGIVWNLFTLAGTMLIPDELAPNMPITHVGILIAYLVISIPVSILAGFAGAKVAAEHAGTAIKILAGVQLAIGIFVEVTYWDLMPAWYHIIFLAIVVPATLKGGQMAGTKGAE